MKRMTSPVGTLALTSAVVVLLLSSGYLHAEEKQCSNRSFRGQYGFQLNGIEKNQFSLAFVGHLTADGNGNITSGGGSRSLAGSVVKGLQFTGTYTVGAQCTGSLTIQFSGGGDLPIDFVVVSDGNEAMFLLTENGDGDVQSGSAKRVFFKRHSERED